MVLYIMFITGDPRFGIVKIKEIIDYFGKESTNRYIIKMRNSDPITEYKEAFNDYDRVILKWHISSNELKYLFQDSNVVIGQSTTMGIEAMAQLTPYINYLGLETLDDPFKKRFLLKADNLKELIKQIEYAVNPLNYLYLRPKMLNLVEEFFGVLDGKACKRIVVELKRSNKLDGEGFK